MKNFINKKIVTTKYGNNNPDIYDNYAYYYTCTYYKIKGY